MDDDVIIIKYIYILGKFVSVDDDISLHNAIAKIIQCNKLAYDGYENKRQCIELVYHGIILKAHHNTGGLLSLNDYIYKKHKFDGYDFVWDKDLLASIVEQNHNSCTENSSGDCEMLIRDSHINEILCMLSNW